MAAVAVDRFNEQTAPVISAHTVHPAQPAVDDRRAPPPPTESIFSPFALSLSFSAAVTKAVRAYERDRAQTRTRRAQDEHEKAERGHDGHGGHHSTRRGAFAELFWLRFGAEYVTEESDEDDADDAEESDLDEKAVVDDDLEDDLPYLTPPMTPRVEQRTLEVPPTDLMVASLVPKTEVVSARTDEFEVIPSVGDAASLEKDAPAELEPNDPWEYIGSDSDSEDDEPAPRHAGVIMD